MVLENFYWSIIQRLSPYIGVNAVDDALGSYLLKMQPVLTGQYLLVVLAE